MNRTTKPRVAIIGHMTSGPNALPLSKNPKMAANAVKMFNFTRVVDDAGQLVDHIAYLKQMRGVPDETRFSVWEMYLCSGLLLNSHLARNGFETKLINYIDSDTAAADFKTLREFAPDVVVVSTTFVLSRKHLSEIGELVREELPGACVVAGGHHVFTTLLHLDEAQRTEYLLSSHMDAFLNDTQGESGLLQFCKSYPDGLGRVPNLIWRDREGTVTHNLALPENNDINDTLIDLDTIEPGAVVHIRTARSCSFKCAFCSYPTIAGDLALMNLDNVIATLHKAKEKGVKALFFVDDTFNVPRPRFEALIDRMIEEHLEMPWYSFLRSQYIDEGLVKKMARSGCKGVFLGVESGSNRILKNMKKGAVVDFYRQGIKWLRDAGITTVGSFIIGFPGETAETVEETRAFIQDSGLEYYFIQPFYYLHHTPIHKRAAEWGLTGEGLFWSHKTMKWSEAIARVNELFLSIDGATFVNPDYTLWEIAYLRSKGMSDVEVKDYRRTINEMTRLQMVRYGVIEGGVTSRIA